MKFEKPAAAPFCRITAWDGQLTRDFSATEYVSVWTPADEAAYAKAQQRPAVPGELKYDPHPIFMGSREEQKRRQAAVPRNYDCECLHTRRFWLNKTRTMCPSCHGRLR